MLVDSVKVKAAILILAHDRPAHLARLVKALSSDWTRVFIHIDGRVDIAPFQDRIADDATVAFLQGKDRIEVNWGGFSQVEATLRLLHASLNCGERFDRFCLLSGSDFPIKSLHDIRDGFSSEKEFIRIDRRLDDSDDNSHCRNVRYVHFRDGPKIEGADSNEPRKVYAGISLYHGCQWWSLTEGCIGYVIDFVDRNRDYTDFHTYTLCPDEIFFHSIVKSSPFSANITHDFETAKHLDAFFALNEHGCHYVDWTSEGVLLPKVLDEADLNCLLNSEAYFGRKFRGRSESLLEIIESAIRES